MPHALVIQYAGTDQQHSDKQRTGLGEKMPCNFTRIHFDRSINHKGRRDRADWDVLRIFNITKTTQDERAKRKPPTHLSTKTAKLRATHRAYHHQPTPDTRTRIHTQASKPKGQKEHKENKSNHEQSCTGNSITQANTPESASRRLVQISLLLHFTPRPGLYHDRPHSQITHEDWPKKVKETKAKIPPP